MGDQDWKPVVLRKNITSKPKTAGSMAHAKATGQVETQQKYGGGGNTGGSGINARKLEEEDATFHHASIGLDFKNALMKARSAKKWKQSDLARNINVKEEIVKKYENGQAIPDQQIINKLNRALGVKLPKVVKPKKNKNDD
jgi:putative transcription factor